MRRIILDILLLIIGTSITAILLDREIRSAMGVYLVFVNVIPAVLLACTLYGLTARVLFSYLVTTIVQSLIIAADFQKNRILHSHLSYADLKLIPMLIQQPQLIVGFVAKGSYLVLCAVVILLLLFFAWRLRYTKAPPLLRVTLAGTAALLLVAITANKSTIPLPTKGWNPFQQTAEATYFGVTANLLFGARDATNVLVRSNQAAIKRFYDDPLVSKAAIDIIRPTTLRPDIVVVQSESLFEPSSLCGTPDQPILSTVHDLNPSNLHVPVFGGRTLQTEFEVLSGVPTKFFSGNQFAYFDLLTRPVPALPYELSVLGYRTIAIHPNERDFWRRGFAIPALGFEHFIDRSAFSDRDVDKLGRVSDMSLTTAVLSELSVTDKPTMLFVITMENHGPWGTGGVHGRNAAESELTDYIQRAVDADLAWKELIDALSKRQKPTLALIYGDHLPGLSATYAERCFKDGKPAAEHWPPLAAWANFDIPPLPHDINSYMLAGWIMEAAQLPMSPYMRANATVRRALQLTQDDISRMNLFNGYGNIAAKMLLTGKTNLDPVQVTLDQNSIGRLLPRLIKTGRLNPAVKQDILLDAGIDGDVTTLELGGRVGSITFRPYTMDEKCQGMQSITYSGDDRQIATGRVTNGANLTTVSLTGVQQLTIKRDRQNSEARCWPITLRLVQMQCSTINCGVAKSSAPHSIN